LDLSATSIASSSSPAFPLSAGKICRWIDANHHWSENCHRSPAADNSTRFFATALIPGEENGLAGSFLKLQMFPKL
jgi:hypothetical protein